MNFKENPQKNTAINNKLKKSVIVLTATKLSKTIEYDNIYCR